MKIKHIDLAKSYLKQNTLTVKAAYAVTLWARLDFQQAFWNTENNKLIGYSYEPHRSHAKQMMSQRTESQMMEFQV